MRPVHWLIGCVHLLWEKLLGNLTYSIKVPHYDVCLMPGGFLRLSFGDLPALEKTTIARLLANEAKLEFEQISAIFTGVADLRKVFERAKARRTAGKGTLLFVDEIHRFNKAQQDGFLPHVESGVITLVGAND